MHIINIITYIYIITYIIYIYMLRMFAKLLKLLSDKHLMFSTLLIKQYYQYICL